MLLFDDLPVSPALGYALVLAIAWAVVSWVRSYRRLSHIPGPPGWGLTVIPWVLLHTKPDMMDRYYRLTVKYGPLVRVGPNTLITSDADTIRNMSATQSPYRRSLGYYAMRLNPGKDHVFSVRDETEHRDRRKRMIAGYSGKENLTLEADIDQGIRDLCQLIDAKYVSLQGAIRPMDLATKIEYLVLDIISKVSFNHPFHDLRDDQDNFGYINEIHNVLPSITWIAPIPGLVKFLTDIRLLQFAAKYADGKMGIEKVKRLAHARVAERFETDGRPKAGEDHDMLGSFIRHGLSQDQANEEVVLNLTAGSDTTATTIRSILLNVITSPRLHRILTEEIDAATAKGILSVPGEIVREDQAKQLPFLQATIREGLRWYPPVAAEMAKNPPPEGDTICGYFVPGGTKVGTCMKGLHRDAELFGPDPETFRPQRWLLSPSGCTDLPDFLGPWSLHSSLIHRYGHETDPRKLHVMLRNNDLVFGSGRFQCLGKPVAIMELNKVLVELLRRYDFELMDILKPWSAKNCGTHLQKDMWVTVRKRRV